MMVMPWLRTSSYTQDKLGRLKEAASWRPSAAVELVEEVVQVGERGHGLHPPTEVS